MANDHLEQIMKALLGSALFTSLLVVPVSAQHTHAASPYADREQSGIAALTPQQVEDLRTGAGMGFALSAELNHYPGPTHVLEMADSLDLTPDQAQAVEDIRSAMSEEAIRLGGAIIEAERQLDMRFAHAHIDAETLREMTGRIAVLYGELRAVHLAAHIETRAILSAPQIETYDRLRGYVGEGEGEGEGEAGL